MGCALEWGHSRVGMVLESRSGAILAAQSFKWCHPIDGAILEMVLCCEAFLDIGRPSVGIRYHLRHGTVLIVVPS